MAMLTGRASDILEAAIQGFIDTGEPISSGWLYEHRDFGIKPAMIRLELEKLSDEGFLAQPHHSAGRVPSDRGYEFFVESIMDTREGAHSSVLRILEMFERVTLPDFLEGMSSSLGILGVGEDESGIHKSGIERLIGSCEWDTQEEVRTIVRDFVEIDRRLREANGLFTENSDPKVFIGKKSPVTRSENLSVIAGSYDTDDGKITLLAVGPKRMDYKKTIKIFKNLNDRRNKKRG